MLNMPSAGKVTSFLLSTDLALISGNTAVHFQNAVACHYIVPEYRNISKATEFNKMAFALAKQADDISLQLLALETEQYVALGCANPAWVIQVGHKVRDIVGFISMGPGARTWLIHEAWAHHCMGDLSRALDLCAQAENQFTSIGMERSDRYLATLDIRGSVHSKKSEYAQAREMYLQMVEKTSATSAPRYHAHALWALVEMNIRMEAEVAVIISSLRTAETMHIADGSCGALYPSFVAAELKLYCGDTQNGRAALLECLSKSRGIREEAVGSCLVTLSDPVRKMHGPIDTLRWAVVYLAFLKKRKDVVGMPHALRRLADIYIMIDDDETTALHLFHAALEAGTKMDIHRLRAQCMVGIGDIMLRRGDRIQAEQMWEAAHPLFVRSAQKKDAASVKKRLEKLCQQDNPHSLQAISERAFDESTDSASGLYKSSDGDTTAVEMRVKIARTSAGTNHLSFAASRNHRNVN
jgi:tetratricopeptide (TPR) repeat protein